MNLVLVLLVGLALYLAIGAAIAVPFVLWGVARVDPAARSSGIPFRLVIIPGVAALWPLILAQWVRASGPGRAPRPEAHP